jgi:hypothetical protein
MHTERELQYSTRLVVFHRPFSLGESPEVYPAGDYEIEIGEDVFGTEGHSARLRLSTTLIVPTQSGTTLRQISSADLDEALRKDAIAGEESHNPSENPDRGEADD